MKILALILVLVGCSHQVVEDTKVEYYVGKIQRGSLTGQPYGPSVPSYVIRRVEDKRVIECVWQEKQKFVVYLNQTDEPQIYSVGDTTGGLGGQIKYNNAEHRSWTYDIQVIKPHAGRVTGAGELTAENGMKILKRWNEQMQISETYTRVKQDEFLRQSPDSNCP